MFGRDNLIMHYLQAEQSFPRVWRLSFSCSARGTSPIFGVSGGLDGGCIPHHRARLPKGGGLVARGTGRRILDIGQDPPPFPPTILPAANGIAGPRFSLRESRCVRRSSTGGSCQSNVTVWVACAQAPRPPTCRTPPTLARALRARPNHALPLVNRRRRVLWGVVSRGGHDAIVTVV